MTDRVARWKAAWESRDPDRVAALYAPDSTHASVLVPRIYPEAGASVLQGVGQIREYARRGLARFTALEFQIVSLTDTPERTAVEYRRHSNVDGAQPAHVLELIEWDGDLIRAVRVFHA